MMTEPMTLAFVALPWHLKFKFIVTKKKKMPKILKRPKKSSKSLLSMR